jgi:hypothetical protein
VEAIPVVVEVLAAVEEVDILAEEAAARPAVEVVAEEDILVLEAVVPEAVAGTATR